MKNAGKIHDREISLSQIDGRHKKIKKWSLGEQWIQPFSAIEATSRPNEFSNLVNLSSKIYAHFKPDKFNYLAGDLSFESNVVTPHKTNNTAYGKFFPGNSVSNKNATILLPNWNSKGDDYNKICRILSLLGVSVLRISLPYHDKRLPEGCVFSEQMVSSNIGLTISAIRQSVLDVRCAIDWLHYNMGFKSISLVGVSIGSCISTLVAAHDKRVKSVSQILMASNFAEVVWTGLATRHIKDSLKEHISLEELKLYWAVISPDSYIELLKNNKTRVLMLTGKYDPVFIPKLALEMASLYKKYGVDYRWRKLKCGHYTISKPLVSALVFYMVFKEINRGISRF